MKQKIFNYILGFALFSFVIAVSYNKGNTDMAKYAANYSKEQFYRGLFLSCMVAFKDQDRCSQGIRNAIFSDWYGTPDPFVRTP